MQYVVGIVRSLGIALFARRLATEALGRSYPLHEPMCWPWPLLRWEVLGQRIPHRQASGSLGGARLDRGAVSAMIEAFR